KQKEETAKTSIMNHLTPKTDIKNSFKQKYSKWIVEESLKFNIGTSETFREMMALANSKVTIPDRRELLSILDVKREQTIETIKDMVHKKCFSITV
ncbi:MAG: hypothetical protein ACK53Y_23275, partial [bacterium]